MPRTRKRLDLEGQHFGRLTVIAFAGRREYGAKKQKVTCWMCRCECGSYYASYTTGNLRSGYSTQCRECAGKALGERNRTHGMCGTNIYWTWNRWKSRKDCLCEQWTDFETFRAAVGPQPNGSSLCRPDTTKPLGPGNAVWLRAEERKALRLEWKINEYATLTGEAREVVAERFRSITRERRRQLLLVAKGLCRKCHGKIVWRGEGKACVCPESRGRRKRHWKERLIVRLQEDEHMTTEGAKATMSGVRLGAGRLKMEIPVDFREQCLTAGSATLLAVHYAVCRETIRRWIHSLNLTRKIIYVENKETAEAGGK